MSSSTVDFAAVGILEFPIRARFESLASLAAIVLELGASKGNPAGLPGIVTIALSWGMVHTAFALHYAHDFYRGKKPGGLQFPSGENAEADIWASSTSRS